MIKAIDLGFGAVKGIGLGKEVEYPSAVGDFRPIRYTTGMEHQALKEKLCVEFEGNKYFIGNIAYTQSVPRVTMDSERFTSKEGLALMMATLILMSDSQNEDLKLITGLPVDMYKNLKDEYKDTLAGQHKITLLEPDGSVNKLYTFNIEKVNIIPQPMGSILNQVIEADTNNINKELAECRLAVVDIGKHTIDLVVAERSIFVDRLSTSFCDVGIYDAYKDLSLALKDIGINIPADSLEPYIRNGKNLNGLKELKEIAFSGQAEKIKSKVINTWPDIWSFDKIYITGGGAKLFGEQIKNKLNSEQVEVLNDPSFSNCRGYYKSARLAWG
jgi:plasmid segregation protein ParM